MAEPQVMTCRSHEEIVAAAAEILASVGVEQSSAIAQMILDDITTDHYLRPRRRPLKGRSKYTPEERVEKLRDRWRRDEMRAVEKNNQTIDKARNRHQEWTSYELEVLSREDLSPSEIADMLGRTLFGVKHARKRLNHGFPPGGRRGDAPPWTGPELEIAARKDLTATQVARMIGRSPNAVQKIRTKLRRDPRKVLLAGVSERTSAFNPKERSA